MVPDISIPHLCWLVLVLGNFLIQLSYFSNPRRSLFLARRITTPLILWGGLLVIQLSSNVIPLFQGLILAAMGLGELGIEGSQVVESQERNPAERTPWTVTASGVLFLAVNIYLGAVVLSLYSASGYRLIGSAGGLVAVGGMIVLLLHQHHPGRKIRLQILIYGIGLTVLAAAAFTALADCLHGGNLLKPLGRAALVLTISDSLVLWRLGANWNREEKSGRRSLLVFLILILLLYYLYIGILIGSSSAF